MVEMSNYNAFSKLKDIQIFNGQAMESSFNYHAEYFYKNILLLSKLLQENLLITLQTQNEIKVYNHERNKTYES